MTTGALVAGLGGLLIGCSGSSGSTKSTDSSKDGSAQAADGSQLAVSDKVIAHLDPRYQSFNLEMYQLVGGPYFYKTYDQGNGKVEGPPIDLNSPRLRSLVKALGPSYIRVSGTMANSTYFDPNGGADAVAPAPFKLVLTGSRWQSMGDFAKAVDAELMTSFAVGNGVRDPSGTWMPDQARSLLEFTQAHDIPLVAVEFYNEPGTNIGLPSGYNPQDYGRDFRVFQKMMQEVAPKVKIAGPSASGDKLNLAAPPALNALDLLSASGDVYSAFSYHWYPKLSERCGSKDGPDTALTNEFLSRVDATRDYYESLRDRYSPGDPMWVTEASEAACGGDRWAATYRDVFRYVETLGRLADGDGNVVFHNSLAAADFGLLDQVTFEPRPDYWAALLWARLMGPTVVATKAASPSPDLGIYAHCTTGTKNGSVTYAVVNPSTKALRLTTASGSASVYQLGAPTLDSPTVTLNGAELQAGADGTLPALDGKAVQGAIEIAPTSVTYIVDAGAGGPCS